jgi:hypothetical protein
MAKRDSAVAPASEDSETQDSTEATAMVSTERTEPVDIGPEGGRSYAFAAAYGILYWTLGARIGESIVNEDGLFLTNVTLDAKHGVTVEQVARDVSQTVKRAQLNPTIMWLNGIEPERPVSNQKLQSQVVQYFRGTDKRRPTATPEYIRIAAKAYREVAGTSSRKGPALKAIKFNEIGNLTPEALAKGLQTDGKVNVENLEHLLEVAQTALEQARSSESNIQSEMTEANA